MLGIYVLVRRKRRNKRKSRLKKEDNTAEDKPFLPPHGKLTTISEEADKCLYLKIRVVHLVAKICYHWDP